MTYVLIWEYAVRPDAAVAFEEAYGTAGPWVAFFRQAGEYLGTELLRDASRHGRYLTIDRWASREAYDAFRQAHDARYRTIDAQCASLTTTERFLGGFHA